MEVDEKGVLTGCDETYEWMLKWWWKHYRKHNDYPVSFCDFGMSKSARIWCASKGEVISVSLPKNFMNGVDPSLKEKWKSLYPYDVWASRRIWFNKPIFLSYAPFKRAVWIDIDCEVRKTISLLFKLLESASKGLIVSEDTPNAILARKKCGLLLPGETAHSTGVMAFTKDSPIIKKWVDNCLERNHLFFSEQDALSRTIFEGNFEVPPIPRAYNYFPHAQFPHQNDEIAIFHYPFAEGKNDILKMHAFGAI